jgi:1-deoxy-D-xylulose-5-phosphate synthase
VFDLAYLRCIPNLIIFAPFDEIALRNMMYTAQLGLEHPIAIRYPRGRGSVVDWKQAFEPIAIGKGRCLKKGAKIAVLSIGHIGNIAKTVINELDLTNEIGLYDMQFVKPLDEALLHEVFANYETIVTLENGVINGGFGSAIAEFSIKNNYTNTLHLRGIPDAFIEHGTVAELHNECGISEATLKEFLISLLS